MNMLNDNYFNAELVECNRCEEEKERGYMTQGICSSCVGALQCPDCDDWHHDEKDNNICYHCIKKYMTAEQVESSFNELMQEHMASNDEIMFNEAFNNYTDSLCKDKQITEYAYNNWTYDFNRKEVK